MAKKADLPYPVMSGVPRTQFLYLYAMSNVVTHS